MESFYFENPWWLSALVVLIPIVWWYFKSQSSLVFPDTTVLSQISSSFVGKLSHLSLLFRVLAVAFLVIALARPQLGRTHSKRKTQGLDIMLVVDTSGSMKAMDFKINSKRYDRLSVVKTVVSKFIEQRTDDRLGLVVFGTQAFAQAPLTLDHDVLQHYLQGVSIAMAGEATAIGDALALSVNRLKDIKSKSKIIILLTDGESTAGKIDPLQAAQAAQAMGVKVYTVGVGSDGYVPVQTAFGYQKMKVDLDEKVLKKIASLTNAQYFRAKDTSSLVNVYETIDLLEKSKVEVKTYHSRTDKFQGFAWASLLFLCFELVFSLSRLRRIP
jgi:Ca-activated chloride channel homolog